jgi:uncharacterized protein YfdQ (DUF2303 family)
MEQPNYKEALQLIQDTARLGDKPHVVEVTGLNADGSKVPAFVAFVADGPGKAKPVSLLPYISEAMAHAERLRLEDAVGPDRRKGTAAHQTLSSFIAHLQRFKDEHSAVWAKANEQQAQLVGIFNYHETGDTGTPRWGDHRAVYPCPLSGAWTAWGAGEEMELNQDEMAEFLESRDYDLTSGTLRSGSTSLAPNVLLSMANKLEVYSNSTARRERDPGTGRVSVSFTEEKGLATGSVQPPSAFLISIPVFEDAEPETMEVRLRVKVVDARAVFTLQIHDAERIWRKSFDKVCQQVILDTALPVYQGTPE